MIRPLATLAALLLLAACAQGPARTVTAAPAATIIPSAPARGEPQGYTGLSLAALRAAFGMPAFVRKDGATQLWRYDGAACKAFFFLYGQPGGEQVRHVETLPRGRTDAADAGCLSALRLSPAKTS